MEVTKNLTRNSESLKLIEAIELRKIAADIDTNVKTVSAETSKNSNPEITISVFEKPVQYAIKYSLIKVPDSSSQDNDAQEEFKSPVNEDMSSEDCINLESKSQFADDIVYKGTTVPLSKKTLTKNFRRMFLSCYRPQAHKKYTSFNDDVYQLQPKF